MSELNAAEATYAKTRLKARKNMRYYRSSNGDLEIRSDRFDSKPSWADMCEEEDMDSASIEHGGCRKRERTSDFVSDSDESFETTSDKGEFSFYKKERFCRASASATSSSKHSSDDEGDSEKRGIKRKEIETDPLVLSRRQKQIDYGKNTKGYKLYLNAVPRRERTIDDIFTPKKHVKYSRRSWDSQIKIWRKRLHAFDPESDDEDEDDDIDLSELVDIECLK